MDHPPYLRRAVAHHRLMYFFQSQASNGVSVLLSSSDRASLECYLNLFHGPILTIKESVLNRQFLYRFASEFCNLPQVS